MLHSSTVKVCFMCNSICLILYHYTINNNYTWCYICSAWFLDIIISTCQQFIFYSLIPIASCHAKMFAVVYKFLHGPLLFTVRIQIVAMIC